MNRSVLLWNQLKKTRLIALISPNKPEDCLKAYEILNPLGIVLEIALRTPAALEGIRLVRDKQPQSLILAGTVLTQDHAQRAITEGACGIVSPDYIPAVVELCIKHDVMVVPGGISDAGKQLSQKAQLYRCDLDELSRLHPQQWSYKLFPAMAGAPVMLEVASALKTVYKNLNIIYSGGITLDNVTNLVRMDKDAMVCSSSLTKNIDDPEAMKKEAEAWLEAMGKGQTGEPEFETKEVFQTPEPEPEPEPEPPPKPVAEKKPASPKPIPTGDQKYFVSFGEVLLRLCPDPGYRFSQTEKLNTHFGGAECNVTASLANYGYNSRFVTALPAHEVGQAGVNALRTYGVDTSFVLRQGDRVGLCFLEHGASQRPTKIIHDRVGASISEIQSGSVDWDAVVKDANWFHYSGVTPALGDGPAQVVMEALEAANQAELTISVDLKYMGKLWAKDEARKVMTPMMQFTDIVIANGADAADIFGIRSYGEDGFRETAQELVERFGLKMAAITLEENPCASNSVWQACLYDRKEFFTSKKYTIQSVDKEGSSDAFASGLIFSLLSGRDSKDALEFAVAASCLKQTIKGDFNLVSAKEVDSLVVEADL